MKLQFKSEHLGDFKRTLSNPTFPAKLKHLILTLRREDKVFQGVTLNWQQY